MTPLELPALLASRFPRPPGDCAWFLLCDHAATTAREHSVLGPVPICARCDARIDQAVTR